MTSPLFSSLSISLAASNQSRPDPSRRFRGLHLVAILWPPSYGLARPIVLCCQEPKHATAEKQMDKTST